jgi:CDGSH-type Zn-finger protein
VILPNGPYYFVNEMELKVVENLQNSKDEPFSVIRGISLCRCRASNNKPFCDDTHLRTDKAYFEKQDNESVATEIRLAKERTLKSLRRYDAIAADESLSAAERMEAERCRADTVIALVKIEIEGPRIVHDTFRRFYGHLQAK